MALMTARTPSLVVAVSLASALAERLRSAVHPASCGTQGAHRG